MASTNRFERFSFRAFSSNSACAAFRSDWKAASACNLATDAKGPGEYLVKYTEEPALGNLAGFSHRYTDDMDWARPMGVGEAVVAWATVVNQKTGVSPCDTRLPAVVFFDPAK